MTTSIQNVIQNPDLLKEHLRLMSRGINDSINYNNRLYREWPITQVSTNVTLGDTQNVVLADASSNAIIPTLPPAGDVTERIYTIKKIDNSTNAVTITSASTTSLIDGSTTKVISSQYVAHTVISDGTNWWII